MAAIIVDVYEAGREIGKYGRFRDQPLVETAIAALAVAQHGVLALDQLRRVGLTTSAVEKRAAAARLHRVRRGVYTLVPPSLLTREGRWMAAALACGPSACCLTARRQRCMA